MAKCYKPHELRVGNSVWLAAGAGRVVRLLVVSDRVAVDPLDSRGRVPLSAARCWAQSYYFGDRHLFKTRRAAQRQAQARPVR